MESTANEIKQAIRQLPIHERAVAIALKNIFDQVKDLTIKEQQEIDQNHLSFISKFKVLEKKASDIIQGKNALSQSDLDTSDQFFSADEEQEKKNLLKKNNKIEQFWYKVIFNSQYGPDLTKQQESILKAVVDLQTNITTNEIQLVLTIQKNNYVSEGVFHRRLILDNGMAVDFEGDEPKWISAEGRIDGVFSTFILTNTKKQDQLSIVFSIVGNVVNEIVPYSLQYYLGVVEEDDDDLGEQDEQDGQEEAQDE